MSSQGDSKDLPESCKDTSVGISSTYIRSPEKLKKCYEDMKEHIQSDNSRIHYQEKTIVGTAAGDGGLVCGLGIFPCLVKLVTKFR